MAYSLSRTQIQDSIKCANWQELRVSLKGTSTETKVTKLQRYLDNNARVDCCSLKTMHIQVLNYLHALSRGGQLEPLSMQEISKLIDYRTISVRIRR